MNSEMPGDWLKQQMDRKGLTTHELAQAVGLRDQAVYYWLTGKTSPKDEAAGKLAELLGLPELEVRRRFNLWVPDEDQPAPAAISLDELKELREQVVAVLNRIEEIQRGR